MSGHATGLFEEDLQSIVSLGGVLSVVGSRDSTTVHRLYHHYLHLE